MAANGFACRSCGTRDVEPVLSLGDLPLVNALIEPGDTRPEPSYPLEAVRCPRCTLVQIVEAVPPATLFRSYAYFSSYSETLLAHARRFAEQSLQTLVPKSLVVEAGSNDGYLLQYFMQAGVRALGIEPAANVAAVARARGVDTIAEFLDAELAERIVGEYGNADLVVANNVLAHVPDLHGFAAALAVLAGDRGVVTIEVPYLRDLVDRLEFDTIYHEHVSYFSVTSMQALLEAEGLAIADVERLPIHGGSIRVTAGRGGAPFSNVERLIAEEKEWGVDGPDRFREFRSAVESLRHELHGFVAGLADHGATIAAYGAAAKGVVLANTCGLNADLVRFVVDRSPHKQGKLLPGVRIPIEEPRLLERGRPEYCLLFAWNLADEIIAQQARYADGGGRFIVPVPAPRVVS